MEDDNKPSTLEKIQSVDISKKALTKRVKRAEGVTLRHARKFVFKRLDKAREIRRHVVIWIVVIAGIILLSGIQLIWVRSGYKTQTNAASGVYAEGLVGKIATLNPFYASSSAEESLSQLAFSRLLSYDKTGSIAYDLASDMKVSADGKSYVFTIRDDVKWQDGQPLSIDDVIFTYETLKNPLTRSTLQGWSQVQIVKIDSSKVQFTLSSVIAAFPSAVASVPIIPKHILADVEPAKLREDNFSSQPIGSGPFMVSLVQDIDVKNSKRSVLMIKNPYYYKGAPKLDRFQLSTYPDSESLYKALKSGEVTAAAGLDSSQIEKLDQSKFKIEAQPINGGVYALFNTQRITDKNIRKALQLASDSVAIRKLFPEDIPAMDLPLSNAQLGTSEILVDKTNKQTATNILNDAGWVLSSGKRYKDGRELVINAITVKGDNEKALVALASDWKEIGVTVNVAVYDPTDASQRFVQDILQPRNYDVLVYELVSGGDPDVYAYWDSSQTSSSGYNFSNYSNAVSDAALASARSRIEPSLRQAKYQTFARQWVSDVPAIGLYRSVLYYAHSKSVVSFDKSTILTSAENRYSDVLYWTVNTKSVYKTP